MKYAKVKNMIQTQGAWIQVGNQIRYKVTTQISHQTWIVRNNVYFQVRAEVRYHLE